MHCLMSLLVRFNVVAMVHPRRLGSYPTFRIFPENMRRIVAVYLRHGFFNPFSILVRLAKYSIIIISQKTVCLLYKQFASIKKQRKSCLLVHTPVLRGCASRPSVPHNGEQKKKRIETMYLGYREHSLTVCRFASQARNR